MNIETIMMQVAERVKDFIVQQNSDEVVETTVSSESELISTFDSSITDLSHLSDEEIQEQLPELVDYTVASLTTTESDIEKAASSADDSGLGALCITSTYATLASRSLRGTGIKTVAMVGFPSGGAAAEAKSYEAKVAIEQGADSIEMILHPGVLKSKNYQVVLADISGVVKAAAPTPVVVSLYGDLLSAHEKMIASVHAQTAGAYGVQLIYDEQPKIDDIELIRETIGAKMGLKVMGLIESEDQAFELLKAGASSIGTTSLFPIRERTAKVDNDDDYNSRNDDDNDDVIDGEYTF